MLDTERHGRDYDPSKVPVIAPQDAKAFANEKLKQMTLEEKILLLTGEDLWRTNPIPRLGISRIKTSDGPTGVRGGIFVNGVTAASLPSGVSLAATWDKQVIKDVSQVLIAEAKSKGVDVLLGPTVCIPRTPLGGRNFEAYSEDPFLTGKLAAEYINTVQAAGIGTCVKHYAANDQENRRFFIDEKIPERALREIHLQPFQIAVRHSNPWTIMTAYNKINGDFCSANHYLIRDILRSEWGWDGLVMSDWFGTNSVVPSLTAGLDLEMPGPVRRRGKHLLEAHRQGLVDNSFIDASTSRVLELVYKTGKSNIPDWKEGPEQAVDLPEHRAILRRAGAEGIVLLKNDSEILPLKNLDGKTVAFIGPNSNRSVATGGGSSNLSPHYRTTPFGSFSKEVSSTYPTAKVVTKQGILTHRYLPLLNPSIMRNPETGSPGFVLSLWRNTKHEGTPFMTEHRPSSNLVCYDGLPPELTAGERYSYRAKTILTPQTTGIHQFSLSSCGPGKLILDGKVIISIERRWWSPKSSLSMSYGSPEERVEVELKAGKSYDLVLESISREPKPYDMTYTGMLEREEVQDGGRIGFLENPGDLDAMFQDAIDVASSSSSDVAIVVVGKDHEWETETSDMVSMDLPGQSNELVRAVARANPRTIVINQTGSPITMPWVNEDTPSFDNYPGENDVVHYGENIYLGYRFYDCRKIEPLFPFGFGLSYTTFAYSNIRLSSESLAVDENIEVQVDVTNTGNVDGTEIVQFYVSPVSKPKFGRPLRELKGWDKVFVRPGETATARATLDRVSISYWDDGVQKWVIEGNAVFTASAAKDSRDNGLVAEFRSKAAAQWVH
ncbi:glycoside hydrolase family 3 domain protein [Colletotrichum kahawae]|uniref:beta-glucosidase n=1 Tax=Colletotrichum kahawae TaxID=34407 RepID=A0AAD9YEC1_COLKA|nr:glycoside hydrolase family 3 domain protein [Colletotrichum kahawae]